MVAGDVGKIGNLLTIDIRVFDVETGTISQAYQENYEGDAAGLPDLMKKIANLASWSVNWTCRFAGLCRERLSHFVSINLFTELKLFVLIL